MTKVVMLHLTLIVLTYEMNDAIDNAIFHQVTLMPITLHDPKVILHLLSIVLPWEVQWFNSCGHQHHMMLTLAPMASQDQESHVACHFKWFDLRNATVPLLIVLTLCDTGANGVTWLKETCYILFHCLYLRKTVMHLWCCWHHVTLILIPMA